MSNICGGIFLGCFGLFWCSFVFFVDGVVVWQVVRQVRASSYATTSGVITKADLKVERDGDGTSYSPAVRYRFEVDGQLFEGERIRYDSMTPDKAQMQVMVARYSLGQAVTVHYHPSAPRDAVLELGLDVAGLLGMIFLTPFNAVAFAFVGGTLCWIRSWQLGRPVLGVSVRDDRLGQTIRIYDVSPAFVALAAWGGTGFVSIFACLLLSTVLPTEAALSLGWIATLGATVFAWSYARQRRTEIRRDALRGRVELRAADGLSYSILQEDLQPVQVSLRAAKTSDGDRIEKFPLSLPFFDPASQQERSLPLPEQPSESAAKSFAAWLDGALRAHPN